MFLRDATEVPVYVSMASGWRSSKLLVVMTRLTHARLSAQALLLFCGKLKIHHIQGGISILPRAAAAPAPADGQGGPGPTATAADGKQAQKPTPTSSSANGSSSTSSSSRANSRPSTPAAAAAAAAAAGPSHLSPAHEEEGSIRLRAPARIAVLSAQLRRLLDAFLAEAWEQGPQAHYPHQQHQLPPPPHQQQQQGHGRRGSVQERQGGRGQGQEQGWGEGKRTEDMKKELMDVLRALLERDGMGRDAI